VFKSTNSGATWSATNSGLIATYIRSLALEPGSPNTLYAGTSGDGVHKSTDGGATWNAVNNGLTNPHVYALAIAPTTPPTLYAGTLGGVFKSIERRRELERGQHWPDQPLCLCPGD
jgi:photosystem II stability/assembly factor-like uncharacterized protein